MGLSNALLIGRSGLLAHQTALEVAGNNLANLATPGYKKQRVELLEATPQQIRQGVYIGRGVELGGITRQVNEALEARLRAAIGDASASDVRYQMYTQIEAIENELSDIDLSTRLGEFFDAFSRLSTNPQDPALRTLATQESATLANYLQSTRGEYTRLRSQTNDRIFDLGRTVDDLLSRIADANHAVLTQEQGSPGGSALSDNRDILLGQLAQYIDVSTVPQDNGVIDVYSGSTPLVLGNLTRGLEVEQTSVDGEPVVAVRVRADGTRLTLRGGELGGLTQFATTDLDDTINTLDTFTHQLIYQVNRLHSQGQALTGADTVTATHAAEDPTLALNDPDAGLEFAIQNGSFRIHVTQKTTGIRQTANIDIDLDGINAAADTSLNALATQLNAVAGVTAVVLPNGKLQISATNADDAVSFSDDTSGALAALGVNTLFTGNNAFDIAVHDDIVREPARLAAALDHLPGDNRTALAITALNDTQLTELDGLSLTQYWSRHVEDVAVQTAQARDAHEADEIIQQNLEAQQQAVSGVNADEETIDLLKYQRAYQASARYISVVDEMLQTLLGIV